MNIHFPILFLVVASFVSGCNEPSTQTAAPSDPSALNSKSLTDATVEDNEHPPSEAPSDSLSAVNLSRESQALIKAGKFEEGYAAAEKAMRQFIAEGDDLAWIMLESIEVSNKRIDVHFNMGERERKMPDDGIVRPLSFRVWSSGDELELLRVIDFEIGRSGGDSLTAAIGEMSESGHANLGIVDVSSKYETIRNRVIEIIDSD